VHHLMRKVLPWAYLFWSVVVLVYATFDLLAN